MASLLFVHGTGVRRKSFDATFEVVRHEVAAEIPLLRVAPCYWGDPYGVRFHHGGQSIPDYESARAGGADMADALALDVVSWTQLLDDPLFELRILSLLEGDADPVPGGRQTPGESLLAVIRALATADPCPVQIPIPGWRDAFDRAKVHLAQDPEAQAIVLEIAVRDDESERAVARAVVAATMVDGRCHGLPALDGSLRDALLADVATRVGQSRRAGMAGRLTKQLRGLATRWTARRRGRVSDDLVDGSGDVLLYQARGDAVRAFIRESILAAGDDLFVLAHSLGGIMSVDLLCQEHLASVKGLITLGSQAPYLYEIGALGSLSPEEPLPGHFPPWLNVYDKSDFLSYLAAGVFGSESIDDFEATSRAPFPESHSAYFTNVKVWRRIAQFVAERA